MSSLCCLLSLIPAACLSFPSPGGSTPPEAVIQGCWGYSASVPAHKAGLGSHAGSYSPDASIPLPVGKGPCRSPVSPTACSHLGQVPGVGLGVKDNAVAHGSIPGGVLQPVHPNPGGGGGGGIRTNPHPCFGLEHLQAPGFSDQQVEMYNNSLPNWERTPGFCSFNAQTGNVHPAFAHLTAPHPGRADGVRAAEHP